MDIPAVSAIALVVILVLVALKIWSTRNRNGH
jgi:hypothetical protein